MNNFEVIFYEKENGEQPAREFILSLDIKTRVKITYTINKIEESGSGLKEPLSKHLEDGIFELRTSYNSINTRILYFFFVEKKIILTNGFIKKTQKTPRNEIEKAKRYRNDFFKRMENNNDK